MTGLFGTSLNPRHEVAASPGVKVAIPTSGAENTVAVAEPSTSAQTVQTPEESATPSVAVPAVDALSYDQIAGNFNPDEESLISQEYQVKQDEEPRTERTTPEKGGVRLLTVTGGLGGAIAAIAFIWLGFIAPKSPVQKVAKPEPTSTPTTTPPDQTAELRSQLAFAEQRRQVEQNSKSAPKPNSTETNSKLKKSPKPQEKAQARQARVEVPRRSNIPTRVINQPPIRTVAPRSGEAPIERKRTPLITSAPRSAPASARSQAEKPINPVERWKQLAELGQQQASEQPSTNPIETANAASTDSSITQPSTSQLADPLAATQPLPTHATEIQTATIGDPPDLSTLVSEGEQGILDQQTSAVTPREPTITDSPLQDEDIPTADTALSDTLNSAAQVDELSQASSDFTVQEVTLGSAVQGTVVVPIVWSQDSRTQTSERGAIRLDEPLLAKDGTVALPAGTILITQTSNAKGIPVTNIIAVIRNHNGNIQQYALPANILVVRSETGEPLSGKNINEVNPALLRGDDLLAGVVGGFGQIGEILNRPQVESSSTVSGGGVSQSTTSRSRSPSVIGAILQGALQPATQRIEQRIQQRDRIQEQRATLPNLIVVQKGQRIMVVAQNILRVNP